VRIIKKNIKSLTIRVNNDCEVVVSAPKFVSDAYIEDVISQNQQWINKLLKDCRKNLYLGREWDMEFSDEFYYSEAKILFTRLIHKYNRYINKPITKVRIKKMNSRWGSCNSKKGYINLNLYLIKKDIEFIEYVILHELAHLIHPNHSQQFYALIASIMPDYRDRISKHK